MLTRFFFALREAGIPVSITEHLTLLQALEARVAEYSVDDFYFLARATMVKDEKHFDRFDRALAAQSGCRPRSCRTTARLRRSASPAACPARPAATASSAPTAASKN